MRDTSETWKSLAAIEGTYVESRAIINNTEYSDIEPPVVTRALMQNGLEVGNVVSAMSTFTLDTTNVIPKSAEVLIEARLVGSVNGEAVNSEWLPQGTFFISKRVRDPITGMRQFECYDALLKTNAVWEPASSTWPQQTEDILDEILLVIGLELDARTSITSYPISQPNAGTTMRDVLSVIAQQNGGNWIVTPNNKLRLVPIQDLNDAGEYVVEIESVIGEYYTGEINEISGIRVVSEDGDSLIGDETGAVVSVTIPEMIAVDLAEELIGKTYRPFSFGNAGYDIAAELGDYIQCEDAVSVIYAETVTLGTGMHGDISAPDLAEIVDEYPYVGSSDKTLVAAKAYAKEYANNAIDGYDQDLTQQEIFNRLTDNGAAQGLVMYNGQLYINASYVNAGFLSAARIKGDTLTLGGANNVNGTMRILDASGNEIGTWTNNGISISAGSIRMSRANGNESVTVSIQQSPNNPLVVEYENTSENYKTILFGNQLQILDYNNSRAVSISPSSINLRESGVSTFEANADLKQYGFSDVRVFSVYGQSDDTEPVFRIMDYGNGHPFVQIDAPVYLSAPLPVLQGGTGATNAASARANLEITPANIGAVANTDIIDIAHGGTNAATSGEAKINLAVHVQLNTASWSDVYTKLSKVTGGQSAFFWITTAEVAQLVSGTTTMAWKSGIVTSTGSGNYTLVAFSSDGTRYTWRITGLTSTSGTVETIKTTVTGIKGNAESAYRTGNVNLTPANIGAAASIMLDSGDTTPSTIYNKINVLSYANRDGAVIYVDQAALNVLTNRTDFTGAYSGLITHTASNTYRFLLTNGGSTMICFYASITSSAITPGNIYRYSGTLMS